MNLRHLYSRIHLNCHAHVRSMVLQPLNVIRLSLFLIIMAKSTNDALCSNNSGGSANSKQSSSTHTNFDSTLKKTVLTSDHVSAGMASSFNTASTATQSSDTIASPPSPPTPMFQNSKEIVLDGVLTYVVDRYDGVIINGNKLPDDFNTYVRELKNSLEHWRSSGKRGVWLKVPIEKSEFISPAVAEGFKFHHAEQGYAMLNHWLSEQEENKMPPNASHQVGVGCVVVHEGKLLLVQEKNGPLRGTGIWKIPTGLADQGEDICDAAVREVLEETGIETEFGGILCFRQNHNSLFGKSDLFFVCVLHPRSSTITPQASEIEACDWVDPEVYFSQSFFQKSGLYSLINQHIREVVGVAHQQHRDNSQLKGRSIDPTIESTAVEPIIPAVKPNPLPASMAVLKLPVGFSRAGHNSLYHFPLSSSSSSSAYDVSIEKGNEK